MATGSIGITLAPLTLAPAKPPHTYLGIANSMLLGAKYLTTDTRSQALPLALLSAHTLECLLKAYLSRNGDDSKLKSAPIRHDLVKLWNLAFENGLSISSTPPTWVTNLSNIHNKPYYLRYSTGVHGISTPEPSSMISGLEELQNQVQQQI